MEVEQVLEVVNQDPLGFLRNISARRKTTVTAGGRSYNVAKDNIRGGIVVFLGTACVCFCWNEKEEKWERKMP